MFGTQEPDVYFYGETLEKIGERKYRITQRRLHHVRAAEAAVGDHLRHGGAQHRPLRHAAELADAGEGRAGPLPADHLLPDQQGGPGDGLPAARCTRPSTLTRAARSATRSSGPSAAARTRRSYYDWFSKTGQGFGSEYRYVRSRSSSGDARFYMLNERAITTVDGSGQTVDVPGRRSFEAAGKPGRGPAVQAPGPARLDYFSDITVQQTYNTNIYDASRRQRSFSRQRERQLGPVQRRRLARPEPVLLQRGRLHRHRRACRASPSAGANSRSGSGRSTSVCRASTPRWCGRRSRRPPPSTRASSASTPRRRCVSRSRKCPFFTVNSSLGWRYTWWSESQNPVTGQSDSPGHQPQLLRSAVPHRRPGAEPDLEHAEQRLRREDQALGRAVGEPAAGHVHRQLRQPHRAGSTRPTTSSAARRG